MLLNVHCNTCMYNLYLYITLRPEFCFEVFVLIYRNCGNPINQEFVVTQSGTPIFKSSKPTLQPKVDLDLNLRG